MVWLEVFTLFEIGLGCRVVTHKDCVARGFSSFQNGLRITENGSQTHTPRGNLFPIHPVNENRGARHEKYLARDGVEDR
jgi:hypothetical protein